MRAYYSPYPSSLFPFSTRSPFSFSSFFLFSESAASPHPSHFSDSIWEALLTLYRISVLTWLHIHRRTS
ncbi:hypothetical protein LINPERPRIM_LOCUS36728 [Linum perenne]